MTWNTCDPCCRSEELSRSEPSYRAAQLQILCNILEAVSGGGGIASNVNVLSDIPGVGATNLGKAEDAVHASGDTGVAVLARRADTASSSSGTDGDYSTLNTDSTGRLWTHADIVSALPAGTNAIGKLAANAAVNIGDVVPISSTTGGFTVTRTNLSTTVTALKSSAQGKLGGWTLYNPNSTAAFIQVFNVATAGAVTLGTTVPTMTIPLPAFGAANFGTDVGIDFSAGIQIAATTTATGLTAPTTNIETSFWWK